MSLVKLGCLKHLDMISYRDNSKTLYLDDLVHSWRFLVYTYLGKIPHMKHTFKSLGEELHGLGYNRGWVLGTAFGFSPFFLFCFGAF